MVTYDNTSIINGWFNNLASYLTAPSRAGGGDQFNTDLVLDYTGVEGLTVGYATTDDEKLVLLLTTS